MEALKLARWQAARLARRHGWKAFAGVALFALAGVVEMRAFGWQRTADEARLRLVRIERAPAAVPDRDPVADTRERLRAFVESLPQSRDSAATIKQIFRIAERSGVSLAQGEYRAQPDNAARLVRYQISLPVKGEARKIHGFVADALNEVRPLTLEGLSFKRDKVGSREAEAQIRFALVTRP